MAGDAADDAWPKAASRPLTISVACSSQLGVDGAHRLHRCLLSEPAR
jgi:hypothetical protein